MNIRTCFLGTAAGLVWVSAAGAADAIVAAEPEPMDYVRVCDAYGEGHFFIPGTEICLKIAGYVRGEVYFGDPNGQDTFPGGGGDSLFTRSRLDLQLSTSQETDYGVLGTYFEVEINRDDNTDAYDTMKAAYIELSGFRVGFSDTLYTEFTGYAGNGINDYYEVDYGDFGRTQLRYTYDTGSGFSFGFAVEDNDPSSDRVYDFDVAVDSYMPDLVAAAGYTAGDFMIRAAGGYDESMEEGAIKVRIDGKVGIVSLFAMGGWSTDGDRINSYALWDGDWAAWLGATADISEKAQLNASINFDDGDDIEAALNVVYTIVPGLSITPELNYVNDMDEKAGPKAENWGGVIRFQRDF
ncbi:porin [Mycoplana sp. MJR14]|uniref:porin n=1 Tax=Mycoplana sp. MJR14 TaxID=3032583 RepID=UPI0011D0A585|nr:porin [Mycoplana sp. MJR14]MDF1634194.1 porin [Mycoplana sp. MJR14]